MTEQRDQLVGPNDGPSLPPVAPLLRLNEPLVAAVDLAPSAPETGESSEEAVPITLADASSIDADVDRQLHGEHESLAPAELRRAALLRLIGLGRFAARS